MMDASWPRVAAIALEENGDVGVVWMAFDRNTDTVHIYDAAILRREALAIIAESLNARGRFIPVAHAKGAKALSDELLKRGVNMTYDEVADDEGMAEVVTRTLWEYMRTARLKVERRLVEWQDEFKACQRVDGKVPPKGFPLMAASRHALQMLSQGRSAPGAVRRTNLFPKVAIV